MLGNLELTVDTGRVLTRFDVDSFSVIELTPFRRIVRSRIMICY